MWNFLDYLWHPPSSPVVSNCRPRDVTSTISLEYMTFLKRAVDVAEHLCSTEKSDLILMQLISVSNSEAEIAALTAFSRKDAFLPCSLAGERGIKQKINGNEGGHMRIETALLALKAE